MHLRMLNRKQLMRRVIHSQQQQIIPNSTKLLLWMVGKINSLTHTHTKCVSDVATNAYTEHTHAHTVYIYAYVRSDLISTVLSVVFLFGGSQGARQADGLCEKKKAPNRFAYRCVIRYIWICVENCVRHISHLYTHTCPLHLHTHTHAHTDRFSISLVAICRNALLARLIRFRFAFP